MPNNSLHLKETMLIWAVTHVLMPQDPWKLYIL
jgi:hypothetical protein